MNLRSFWAFLGENNHRAGRNSRRDRRLEIGKTRSRRKSASFSGLGRKTSPENGQKSEFSELLKNGSSSEAKVLKRYGRLLAAPAAFRERVEFRANRLVGLHTHEGVGDRTERPFFGPKSGGWGGVSGCHQSSTCRRYYRGVETKSGIGQMKSCQISVKAMGAWRDERFSGRPGAGSLPPDVPPVAVGSGPGSAGLHGRVNASDGSACQPGTLLRRGNRSLGRTPEPTG